MIRKGDFRQNELCDCNETDCNNIREWQTNCTACGKPILSTEYPLCSHCGSSAETENAKWTYECTCGNVVDDTSMKFCWVCARPVPEFVLIREYHTEINDEPDKTYKAQTHTVKNKTPIIDKTVVVLSTIAGLLIVILASLFAVGAMTPRDSENKKAVGFEEKSTGSSIFIVESDTETKPEETSGSTTVAEETESEAQQVEEVAEDESLSETETEKAKTGSTKPTAVKNQTASSSQTHWWDRRAETTSTSERQSSSARTTVYTTRKPTERTTKQTTAYTTKPVQCLIRQQAPGVPGYPKEFYAKKDSGLFAGTPKREGYYFDGWYSNGTKCNTIIIVSSDMTLTAKWIRKGDVNKDGTVDEDDVRLIEEYIAGIIDFSDSEFDIADCNGDGIVNSNDTICVIRIIQGID